MSLSSLSGIPDENAWFHDQLTRKNAELLLKEIGKERAFLVRESTSNRGDFALSVLYTEKVRHIKIKRHGEDAFFSVDDGEQCHGLDELIKKLIECLNVRMFSTSQGTGGDADDDVRLLKIPVIKCLAPAEVRRHGRTNLLHQAINKGAIGNVAKMVACRVRCIDAKNEDGQTAVHLASMNGFTEILRMLIKAGANVNATDSYCCTPLHYACRNNFWDAVYILMGEGKANPQIRRNNNNWVAMHEGASKGYLKCIQALVMFNAPLRPRTRDNVTPSDIAIEKKHDDIARFIDSRTIHAPVYAETEYMVHQRLERDKALEMLKTYRDVHENDKLASYFLVRRHSNKDNTYVLTILLGEKSYSFEIGREIQFFFIDDGPYLDSLEDLVQHYSRWADGLPCRLQVHVSPSEVGVAPLSFEQSNKSLTSPSGNCIDIPPPLPKRSHMSTYENAGIYRFYMEENSRRYTPTSDNENIPIEALDIGDMIGEGEYGQVFMGKLRMSRNSEPMNVALKTLKEEKNNWNTHEFLTEARTMLELEHPHIVRLIGICRSQKTYMVQELCEFGSLKKYLVDNPDKILPSKHFCVWAHQIANGMVYLHSKRFIHRDLAVRNILLKSEFSVKICDFGLSRALRTDNDYYTSSRGGRWPIKWYAPESYTDATFSHATDVWSFGITLWEIYSFGSNPYGSLQCTELIDKVLNGYRLEKPHHCPAEVYKQMLKCWSSESELRPSFELLEDFFRDNKPYFPPLSPGLGVGDGDKESNNGVIRSPTSSHNVFNSSIHFDNPPPLPLTPEPKKTLNNLNTVNANDLNVCISLMYLD